MSCLFTDDKCINCLISKYADTDRINLSDKDKTLYLKELLKILSDAPIDMSAPEIIEDITVLQNKYSIDAFEYSSVKRKFNDLMLSLEEKIWNKILKSKNPLYLAMAFAFTGNYIDFGAMSDISYEKLSDLIENTENIEFDKNEFSNFSKELEKAENIVYLTDNCGEIVFDKLLIRLIKEKYPKISLNVIVRGKDVLNDATLRDANQVGLDKLVNVTDNGTGIAGTALKKINKTSLNLIENADIIISKGMGNFETLKGCGKNIYYMFLCKCNKFSLMFNVPKLTYLLKNEKRI